MAKFITMGEPLAVFIAQEEGLLKDVSRFKKGLAGAELNVAIGLTRLGHQVDYITKVGKDPLGEYITECMETYRISTERIKHLASHQTGFYMKSKVSEGDPDIAYYRKGSAASTLCVEDILHLSYRGVDALHVTGISLALSASILEAERYLIKEAAINGIPIFFDPNLRPKLWESVDFMKSTINEIAYASDYFLPGITEARMLTGLETIEEIAQHYLVHGTGTIVIKLGPGGAYYASKDEAGIVKGFHVSEVVDTVGAGDGFAVGVMSSLLEGHTLEEAVCRGNAIGALAVLSEGDNSGLPTCEELNRFIKRDQEKDQASA